MRGIQERPSRRVLMAVSAVVAAFAAPGWGCGPGAWPGGIGAVLRYHADPVELTVERVPEGGAAAHAGLRQDDRVLSIDGVAVSSLDEERIRTLLRGEVGTRVRLRIVRDGQERDVEIERAPYR